MPTALTVASESEPVAEEVASWLRNERVRVYTSRDVAGVQLGGAIKNVMAIAAGISDGLGFGANARAALITRGLAELTRLGVAMGGQKETFMGLTGAGDLILTCTDNASRNRRVGLALGQGKKLPDILSGLGQEAEGVATARELYQLAKRLNVEMPITDAGVSCPVRAPATPGRGGSVAQPRAEAGINTDGQKFEIASDYFPPLNPCCRQAS